MKDIELSASAIVAIINIFKDNYITDQIILIIGMNYISSREYLKNHD